MVGCYADANFSRLWIHEDPQDPICDRTRTGFVVTFPSCTLLCMSNLHTEIALSKLNSEYVELSHSVRSLLPLEILIKEVIDNLGVDSEKLKFFSSSTVYEDNNLSIFVATSPRMTPISKHIAIKYHWLRQHVGKEFVIRKI